MNIFKKYPRPWKFKQASFLATGTHEITCANGKDIQEIPYIYIPLGASTRFWDELVECVNENAELKQRIEEIEGFHANLLMERDSALRRIAELEAKIQALELDMDSFECTTQPNKQ